MSKKNSKIFIIIILLSVLFSIEIGFANSSITYDKLADIDTSNFSVRFDNIKEVKCVGVNSDDATAFVSQDGKKINFNVSNMQYPGAGIEYSVDVINNGDLPIKIVSIEHGENEDIKIKVIDEEGIKDKKIKSNEKCRIHFYVVWDYDSTNVNAKADNLYLKINCMQDI